MTRRVVVTGMGGLCPLGNDWKTVGAALRAGRLRRVDRARARGVRGHGHPPRRARRGLRGARSLSAQARAQHGPRLPARHPRHRDRPRGRGSRGERAPARRDDRNLLRLDLGEPARHGGVRQHPLREEDPQGNPRHGLHPVHEPHGARQPRSVLRGPRARHLGVHRMHLRQPGHRLRLRHGPLGRAGADDQRGCGGVPPDHVGGLRHHVRDVDAQRRAPHVPPPLRRGPGRARGRGGRGDADPRGSRAARATAAPGSTPRSSGTEPTATGRTSPARTRPECSG